MQKIVTCLGFNGQAEEAINLYTSTIPNSKILSITRTGEAGPGPKGSVLAATFVLDGQEFTGINGGPEFKFTEAMSLIVNCDTQEEVDHYWSRLSAGGEEVQCGWLKDRFGVAWQITPVVLTEMLKDKDPARAKRVMAAMLKMKKIDIAELKKAYAG